MIASPTANQATEYIQTNALNIRQCNMEPSCMCRAFGHASIAGNTQVSISKSEIMTCGATEGSRVQTVMGNSERWPHWRRKSPQCEGNPWTGRSTSVLNVG